MDISNTIAPKSDQLNADDLISGPRTIRISRVTSSPESPEQPVSIFFDGDNGKPYKPCKSMRRVMVSAWGADASLYVGRSLTIYRDPKVAFGGMQVGGIRISHMTNIDADMTMPLTVTKAKRAPYTVRRLVVQKQERPQDRIDHVAVATREARKGTESFRGWFNTDEGKEARASGALTGEVLAQMREIAAAADAAKSSDDSDPFGLPQSTTATDPEIEAQIRAELAARDAEHTASA